MNGMSASFQAGKKNLRGLENTNRWLADCLDTVASAVLTLQSKLDPEDDTAALLEQTKDAINRLVPFDSVGFAWFDEDGFDIKLAYSHPEQALEDLRSEIDFQIEVDSVGWAMTQNRSILVPASFAGKYTVINTLTTRKQTLGFFFGITAKKLIPDVYLKMISIVLLNCSHVLESNQLNEKLARYNRDLESIVQKRTQALTEAKLGLEKANIELNASIKRSNELASKAQKSNEQLSQEIEERKRAEKELANHREHLEALVEERTRKLKGEVSEREATQEALAKRAEELATFNEAMVDREMRIIELKEEVNRLSVEMGGHAPYSAVWEGDSQAEGKMEP